jgi:hypothetical protein
MAAAAELQAEIARLQERYRIAQNGLASLNRNLQSNQAILARYTSEVATIPGQVAGLEAQINAIQTPPPATASQAAGDDASRGPNKPAPAKVSASGRIVAPSATTTPTNADVPATSDTGGTTGTDAPTRTTEQTQATNGYNQGINIYTEDGTLSNFRRNPETGLLYDASGLPGGVDLKTEPGTPTRDDAANNSTTTKQTNLNAAQANPIEVTPQPNILDRYNNYAWSASVYLLSGKQYSKLMTSKDKKIDGYSLLFQSGGAGVSDGVIRPPYPVGGGSSDADAQEGGFYGAAEPSYPTANRNPFFTNDFYIDSVAIKHQTMGKGTGAAHLNTDIKFTVIEPQGITLLNRLYDAVANAEPRDESGKVNYTTATYLMVLRFYGYDESGNIVYPIKGGLDSPVNTSDPAAVVEKFVPFTISKVNWTIGTKTVSYEFEGLCPGQNFGGGSVRGTIPYDVQLVDSTVGGLLGGDAKYSTGTAPNANPGKSTTTGYVSDSEQIANIRNNEQSRLRAAQQAPNSGTSQRSSDADAQPGGFYGSAPPTATAAPSPKKTITLGLMGAMNEFQQELVKSGKYNVADEYSIEFVGIPGLASAADISDAKIQLPNVKKDTSKSPMQKPGNKDTKSLDQKTISVDYENRNFSITAGQQILQVIELVIRNSSYVGKQKLVIVDADGTQHINQQTNKNVTWFTISMSCERKGFDDKRNDYGYKIKYTVSPFLVKNLNSQYFPKTKFTGVHKTYPFWFTGQNVAVKDYQETINSLFTTTISGSGPGNSLQQAQARKFASSMPEIVKFAYSPRSDQSSFGADGKNLEPNANAAEILYDPSDLATAKVRIIGDPAWIMQGSQFKPVTASTVYPAARTGFEADGTISFDTQDVMFEMVWQRPEDYDLSTGLADPYAKQSGTGQRQPLQSRVYIATECLSEFRGGSFEQTLTGSIYIFPKPDGTNTANPAVTASTAKASTDTKRTSTANTNTTGGPGRLTQAQLAAAQRFAGSGASGLRSDANQTVAETARLSRQSQATPAGPTIYPTNVDPVVDGNSYDTNSNATGNNVSPNPQPAGAPRPPTSGTGGTVGVTEATNSGPPKLNGPVSRANATAAARGNQGRGSQSPGNPTSTTNPSVQQINKTDN